MSTEPISDASEPLGCFLTFRAYGTWLHGNERGSVDSDHNKLGTPRLAFNPARRSYEQRLLARAPVYLGRRRREATRQAITRTCALRGWYLHALNVRTNHVHLVATADVSPKSVLAALKAVATAEMRRLGYWTDVRSPWAEGGSARSIWTAKSLGRAIEYVLHRQGPDLD